MSDTSDRLVVTAEHRELLGQVLDTWSVLVLEELCEAPRRFNELRRLIPVTQKSLTRPCVDWSATASSTGR